ncbi:serine/threonine-protein phosphatase 1 regulatory subunit 10 [Drosophila biarmipes]|uniref:serine/threonine-protein phosphatase 1 regulatory subunit 10 n=1 Tax=Drosophila biarmipes TaxID=125945 RepID=UPI001CDAA831|nr:serine/threonine-protein phosphatase 1 regulatory subunit 10 [Drosophila biarmipes]
MGAAKRTLLVANCMAQFVASRLRNPPDYVIKSMTWRRRSLVTMFASKRQLAIAFGLIFWTCLAVAQNASDKVVSDRGGNQLDQAGSATAKGGFEPPPEFYRGPGSGSVSNTLSGSSAHSKSFEPPPEFYRGPGSGGGSGAGSGVNPLSGSSTHPSLGSVGESLSETYNKWRAGGAHLQDRISVGPYGAAGGVASHAPTVGSFESNSHPYPYEYSHSAAGLGGGGGGASGAYFGSSSVEAGIPFDVYGSRPGHVLGHAHYSPPEYVYPYPLDPHPHELAAHKGPSHGDVSSKALLAKSFLIPLASAAVLGIAAALVSNPLLLQLGTVSGLGTIVGKRKRRATGRNLLTHKAHKYTL